MAKKRPDRTQRLSHAEYFALEQAEDQRYEFVAGEAFTMTGGTETHALIAANTLAALVNALRDRPCRVYGADMKLRIATYDKFCYPDAMVLCERGRREPDPVLRHAIYRELEEILAREALLVPLVHGQSYRFFHESVDGGRVRFALPEVRYEELRPRR